MVFIGVPLGIEAGVCTRLWFWISLVGTKGAAAVHPQVVMAAPRMSRMKREKKPVFIKFLKDNIGIILFGASAK
jgi:hypothetical protein